MASTESVRSFPTPEPSPDISLDFSPHKEAYVYVVGEATISPTNTFYAHVNETVTFTATINMGSTKRYAVSYRWDFGDGSLGYSNPTTHTYTQPNSNMQVTFIMTDNRGVEWKSRKSMYLK